MAKYSELRGNKLSAAAIWAVIMPAYILGRLEETKETLAALDDLPIDSGQIVSEAARIEENLRITGQGRFRDIFTNSEERLFHRTYLTTAGQLFQQICGINALAFHLPTLYNQYIGLPATNSQILATSVFFFQMVYSPIGVLTGDRFGRRKLIVVSTIGIGCCLVVMTDTVSAQIVSALMIFLFGFVFPTGFIGLIFLYVSEIAPLSVRVPITSISTGRAWAFNFLIAEIIPVGFATLNYRYFIIYAVINLVLIAPCVYSFWPETAARSLEAMNEIFLQSNNIFDPKRVSKSLRAGPLVRSDPSTVEESKQPEKTAVQGEKGVTTHVV